MVCREYTNHINDCYFFIMNIIGLNWNNRVKYDISISIYPLQEPSVPHSNQVPIPIGFIRYKSSHRKYSTSVMYLLIQIKIATMIMTKLQQVVDVLIKRSWVTNVGILWLNMYCGSSVVGVHRHPFHNTGPSALFRNRSFIRTQRTHPTMLVIRNTSIIIPLPC